MMVLRLVIPISRVRRLCRCIGPRRVSRRRDRVVALATYEIGDIYVLDEHHSMSIEFNAN